MIYSFMLKLHVITGSLGFALGIGALLLPKFGLKAVWHRVVGRVYGMVMLIMSILSIPLAVQSQSTVLLVLGIFTLALVSGGWAAIWGWRGAPNAYQKRRTLRRHIILMSASYIGAWTAFLVNVQPLGGGSPLFWFYALGPTLVGIVLIARRVRQLSPVPKPFPAVP